MEWVIRSFLVLLILFALMALQSRKLIITVIHLGVFSMIASLLYFLYQAPDVALVEAIVGSVLMTILFLVALHQCKILTLYHSCEDGRNASCEREEKALIHEIDRYCTLHELEYQVVDTMNDSEELRDKTSGDLIVARKGESMVLYADSENPNLEELLSYLADRGFSDLPCILCEKDEGHLS